jgi:hypothetical protein
LKDLIRFRDLIILEMGQINFNKGLIGEKLSLRAQIELNWEDWNFRRLNFIFNMPIDWNQG